MSFGIRIKRRNAYQAMNTILAFQIAVCKITIKLQRNRFNTGNISILLVNLCNFISIAFTPAYIHAHEHVGPIAAFCSSRS